MPSVIQASISMFKSLLLRNGLILSRATPPEKLRQFFGAVRPVKTGRSLVRVGGDGDGGYLLPDDLDGIDACFSPGVSDIATFEEDLVERGIRCFLADYSVDRSPIQNDLIDFEKKFLGPVDKGEFMTLENWLKRKAARGGDDLLLQMDIEGAEYGVILGTSHEALRRFRIIIVEFHGIDALCDKRGFELINLTFSKLLTDFEVAHIHPNNCFAPVEYEGFLIPPLLEFTFLRRDRVGDTGNRVDFPHQLDKASLPDRPDYPLPDCWFK